MKERSSYSANGPTLRCGKCHKIGHTSGRCLNSNKTPNDDVRKVLCSTHKEHYARAAVRGRPTSCSNCGREGRVARFCWQRPACRKCGLEGHTVDELKESLVRNASGQETKERETRATRKFPSLEGKGLPRIRKYLSALVLSSDGQLNSSRLFKISECKKYMWSNLDSVTLAADMSKSGKLTFLVDMGADISVIRHEYEDRIRPHARNCSTS
jgi:hypothetical protein